MNIYILKKDANEMTEMVKFMYHINAFIVEIPFLMQLQNADFKKNIQNIRFNIDYFRKFVKSSDGRLQLTFGIFNESVQIKNTMSILSKDVSFITHSNIKIYKN